MAKHCTASEYFDSLLQECISCHNRCPRLPEGCKYLCPVPALPRVQYKGIPLTSVGIVLETKDIVATTLTALYKEIPPTSVRITNEAKVSGVSPETPKETVYIIWISLALIVLVLSAVSAASILLHRSRKKNLQGDAPEKGSNIIKENPDIKIKSVEPVHCNGLKIPVMENEDSAKLAADYNCDTALSDCLFPLPAVEEGAAILVTTKTSASFNSDPGVRRDAFVEISECPALDENHK
ncbi:tumor necrosis factor receptor superfamily member 17 [Gastrophryne carolinensis]